MQKIQQKDGSFKRAFCLVCLKEHRPWIGGELCEHFDHAEECGPEGTLQAPQQ
jgi:hypothetical protein